MNSRWTMSNVKYEQKQCHSNRGGKEVKSEGGMKKFIGTFFLSIFFLLAREGQEKHIF